MAEATERKVDQTSTWAIAIVVAVIVVISLLLEHALHKLAHVCISPSSSLWLLHLLSVFFFFSSLFL